MELSRGIWLALWIFYRIISENQANSVYTRGQVPLSLIPWQPGWFPIWLCCASICLAYCMHVFFICFPPFFSPVSHTVPIKKTVTVSVEWLLFGGYWLCLSYLINTGNTMYTGRKENVQKMMPGVAVTFLRHQNWCRMFTPPWPQYCYELQAGRGSGEPTGSREMLQKESTSWKSLEDWDLEQGKNGSKHYVPSHQEMTMQGLIFLMLIFLLS